MNSDTTVKNILEKIKNKEPLDSSEGVVFSNYLEETYKFRYEPEDDGAARKAKKRKLDEPSTNSCEVQTENSPKKDVKTAEVQCTFGIFTDYKALNANLCEMYPKQSEWSLEDRENFKKSFDATFGLRRSLIVSDDVPPPAPIVKKIYPYLFHKNQVFHEFELISFKNNMFQNFQNNTELYSEDVLRLAPQSPLKNKIEKYMLNPEDSKWCCTVGSLLLLPAYMEEERRGIILFDDEELLADHCGRPYIRSCGDDTSCLKREGKFYVFVDDIELCTTENLIEAYFALMASYYIFNAVYPECSASTFSCLERLYVEYTDVAEYDLEESVEEKIKLLSKLASDKKKLLRSKKNGTTR